MSSKSQEPVPFRKRILSSIKLSSLQFLSKIALRLVSTVVLTRLLAPEVYGVFAVVLVYRYILEMLSDIGLRPVILTREEELEDKFLQTCWSVGILRGLLLFAISGLIGLVIYWLQQSGAVSPGSAYGSTELPLAIFALGSVSLLGGFLSTNRYAAEREMKFGHVTIGMIGANITGLIATLILAYMLRSVWALVFGAVAQTLFLVVHSHFFFKGAPMRPAFDREAIKIIIARGKWIVGHSSLTAASQAADRMFLGFATTSAIFGFYYIARQVLEIVNTFLNSMHWQMGLQVFTHILKNPETFRKNYYRYRLFFDTPAALAAGGLIVLAPTLVEIIFDDRYGDVAPIIQILVLALPLLGPLTIREAYGAERRFREMTLVSLVSVSILWVGLTLALFVFDNFEAALYLIALHRIPEVMILWIGAARNGWIVWWREALVPVIFVIGMGLGWLVEKAWLWALSGI